MLSKETQLGFLRFFLIGSTLLSLIIPLIDIPNTASIPNINLAPTLLPMVAIDGSVTTATPWYVVVFIVISALLMLKVGFGLMQIIKLYRKSTANEFLNHKIRSVSNLKNSFTFFRWIFIDTTHFDNPQDIILHEMGHVKKLHTLDILFFNTLTILFWWVPSVWLMIRELKNVHEFEADAFALQSINQKTYTKTLVHDTLRAHGMNLASSFDDASIFNRLNFIKKMKKKINPWKVASIAALVAISGAMFACEDELDSEIKRIAEESNQNVEYSDQVNVALLKLKKENPDKDYIVVETLADNEESLKRLKKYDPQQIESIFVTDKDGEKVITMIVSTNSDLFKKAIELQEIIETQDNLNDASFKVSSSFSDTEIVEENPVFTIVENPASFPGGIDAWGQYLKENMKYPKEAIEKSIQGRVFVQFIVEANGELSNIQVVKGIGAGCDEEAVRVITSGPNWVPGKQRGTAIRQKMIQNISFQY